MQKSTAAGDKITRWILLGLFFIPIAFLVFIFVYTDKNWTTGPQKWVYTIGLSALLGLLATLWLHVQLRGVSTPKPRHGVWYYPVLSGLLALFCMSLCYVYLGIWPIGNESGMIVDMHHQYAPLLSKLREMFLHGGSPLYIFEAGLGASFLPMFGYYLASPLNLLLVFFPENLLTEGILVITLLKNALAAACFAACVQSVYHRRDISVPVVAVMYSLMMYMLAYSWNIMWLDCVAMLPLVVMFFERMMRTGKFLGYILSLAYALFSNYYIGFMLCVFLVLYYIVYILRKRRTTEQVARSFLRFVVGSLLAGGLVMFLLLPVYVGLQGTSAAGGGFPEKVTSNFDMFNLLGRHLYTTSPTIRSGNLPNIYCGLLPVVLLPIFATTRAIPARRRAVYMGLAALLGISFVLNFPDLIWHGLHSPNDLPYRFSFIYSFVLLLIAFETLCHIREIRPVQAGGAFVGLLAYLLIEQRFGDDKLGFGSIYISLLLVLLYALIVAVAGRKRKWVRAGYCALLVVVAAEMVTNGGTTLRALNSSEYFTDHNAYVDNDKTRAIRQAVRRTQAIGDAAADGAFYRLETLPRKTSVDTALFNYRGMTFFSSSNYYNTTKFMGYVGYAINGVNSHLFHSFVPAMDSLLGIRYVAMDSNITSHPQLKQLETVTVGTATEYIYENSYALPVAYMANSAIKDWAPAYYAPFQSQNTLFAALTGIQKPMYVFQDVTVREGNTVASVPDSNKQAFTITTSSSQTGQFDVTLREGGQTFIYLDCRAAKSMSASLEGQSWSVRPYEPYIIDAGVQSAGTTVSVSITAESSCSGNIYVVIMDPDVFEQSMETLKAGGMQVTSFTDSTIKGTIDAGYTGAVFTSIPYDAGWRVKVDGKRVETYAACDAMLAFDLAAGSHTVEFSFVPRGLLPGILLSLISLVVLVLLCLWMKRKGHRPVPSFGAAVVPGKIHAGMSGETLPPMGGAVPLADIAGEGAMLRQEPPVQPEEAPPAPPPPAAPDGK